MSSEQDRAASIRGKLLAVLGGGFCTMTPKIGSVVAGAYMILMTNMYLIFEVGHLNRSTSLLERLEPDPTLTIGWVIPYCYYVAIALALITYPIAVYFIRSVYQRDTTGIFIYLGWVAFYDIANCVIITLTSMAAKTAGFSIHPLEWIGLGMRLVMDCFWAIYIIIYALLIIEDRRASQATQRSRRRPTRHGAIPSGGRMGIRERRI